MAGESTENSRLPLPPPSLGKVVTILSIDGGGIRGLIPAVILRRLETELQTIAKDKNARIADYFDVIAGTSTGGLISAMLATPDPNNRPLFTAAEVVQFYKDEAANIFNKNEAATILPHPTEIASQSEVEPQQSVSGPRYKGNYLRHIIRQKLGDKRLHDTLTDVVIPTFDMKKILPTIFSSYKLKEVPKLDVKLSDICIATSAAPTYFPPHFFQTDDNKEEFHLTDGGLAAVNPALAALSEVAQQKQENPEVFPMMQSPNDYTNIVLISLGCGVSAVRNEYDAQKAANWGPLTWVLKLQLRPPVVTNPLVEFLYDGNWNMTDYHLVSLFHDLNAHDYYLRVQDNSLTPEMAQMDNATPENLKKLEDFAEELLKKPIKRVNIHTFALEEVPGKGTNEENLKRLAQILYEERQVRLEKIADPNMNKRRYHIEKHHRGIQYEVLKKK